MIRLHTDDAKRLSEGTLVPGQLDNYHKAYGFVHVPVYSNTGIATAKKMQAVVDTIFVQGEPAISTIQR